MADFTYDLDNIFGKILEGTLPSKKVYEDDLVYAFEDINPGAPVHILIIPREQIRTLNDMEDRHKQLIGHIFFVAKQIAAEKGLAENGYRLVNNCNDDGGQTVYHLHFHLLGGRKLSWPPG